MPQFVPMMPPSISAANIQSTAPDSIFSTNADSDDDKAQLLPQSSQPSMMARSASTSSTSSIDQGMINELLAEVVVDSSSEDIA